MATHRLCSIPNCGKPHVARGWCGAHLYRWRQHGDPLGGATAKGECLRYLNEVIFAYEGDECLPWPFTRNNKGSGQIRIAGRPLLVARLVCEEKNGPPPTPEHEAAHSCGKGHEGCCTKRHLVWKTHAENMADQVVHGTRLRGERQNGAKLVEADVIKIRALRGKLVQREIGKLFGVGADQISRIQTGKEWGHVPW